jgi:hypothetical protein
MASGTDIFNKTMNVLGGAWSADGAAVAFSGTVGASSIPLGPQQGGIFSRGSGGLLGPGMIVQNVNIGYQQQVTRLYEIGSNYTYFVGGRVQGNMTIGRVIGPAVLMAAFYTAFGDVCNAQNNTMNLYIGTGCYSSDNNPGRVAKYGNAKFTISFAVLINVGISVAAQDMVINEQLQLMFVQMFNTEGNSTTVANEVPAPTAPF